MAEKQPAPRDERDELARLEEQVARKRAEVEAKEAFGKYDEAKPGEGEYSYESYMAERPDEGIIREGGRFRDTTTGRLAKEEDYQSGLESESDYYNRLNESEAQKTYEDMSMIELAKKMGETEDDKSVSNEILHVLSHKFENLAEKYGWTAEQKQMHLDKLFTLADEASAATKETKRFNEALDPAPNSYEKELNPHEDLPEPAQEPKSEPEPENLSSDEKWVRGLDEFLNRNNNDSTQEMDEEWWMDTKSDGWRKLAYGPELTSEDDPYHPNRDTPTLPDVQPSEPGATEDNAAESETKDRKSKIPEWLKRKPEWMKHPIASLNAFFSVKSNEIKSALKDSIDKEKNPKRRRGIMIGTVAVTAAVAGVGVYVAMKGGGSADALSGGESWQGPIDTPSQLSQNYDNIQEWAQAQFGSDSKNGLDNLIEQARADGHAVEWQGDTLVADGSSDPKYVIDSVLLQELREQ